MSEIKLQSKKWQRVKLGEIAEFQYGYTTSAIKKDTGTKFLRITDIVPDLINWETVPFCNIDEEKVNQYKIHKNNILIARTGATAGYAKLIRKEPKQSVFASYLIRLKIKDKNINPEFIGRIIESEIFKEFVSTHIGGVAQPHANAPILKNFEISVPSLLIQKQIAEVLSTYDDLIENNTKRIKILEEIAQTIYKEWFVYFRFPGYEKVKMVDSKTEFGKIPEGWLIKSLLNITNIKYGKTLPTKFLNNSEKYKVYGAAKIIGRYKEFNREKQTVIVGCRGSVGQFALSKPKSFITNNSFYFDFNEEEKFFYFYQLKNRGVDDCITGSAQPQITITNISSVRLFIPSKEIISIFQSQTKHIHNHLLLLENINDSLRQARDLLLPKLIDGEIQV